MDLEADEAARTGSPPPQRKIAVDASDRDLAHRIAGALQDLVDPPPSALTVFEAPPAERSSGHSGWRIEAYYDDTPDVGPLQAMLEDLLATALPPLRVVDVPSLNWVALSQAALPPVAAGRFTVHGSHDRARVARGPHAILIDAGEAFGTAHHATTYGCLGAIDRLTRRGRYRRILDLGTGSGVLSIALARALPQARIIATDLDKRSVEVARENMAVNGVAGRIRALEAAGLDHGEIRRHPSFDLIIANILAGPLIALAGPIARKLAPEGRLVLSGLLIPQAPAVIAAYRARGLALVRHDRITGWSTLTLVKRD